MKTIAIIAIALLLAPLADARGPRPEPPAPAPGDTFTALIDKARQAEEMDDFDAAVVCWTAALKLRPGDATLLFNRANDYAGDNESPAAQQNNVNAIADYTEALRINPKYIEALLARARACEAAKHLTLAIADCNEAIRIDPKNLPSYQQLAGIYQDLGQMEKVLAVYDAAVAANPDNADAYWNRAAFCFTYYPDKAIADYTEVIRRDPKLMKAYDARARVYAKTGKWDEAIADFTTEINAGPAAPEGDSSPYKARAAAYAQKKQWDLAQADLDKLITSESDSDSGDVDYDAYVARGDASRAKGDYAKALTDYTIAIHSQDAQQADLDTAHLGRGETYWAMGQKDKAIADFTRAVELHLHGEACQRLAQAEFDTGQFDKAIACSTLGIVRCDMGMDAYILRGAAHAAKGDAKLAAQNYHEARDSAIEDCQKSKWKKPGPIDTLAAIESRLGEFYMAAIHEQMALDLAAHNADAQTLKAMQSRLDLYRRQKPWPGEIKQDESSESPE